MKAAYIHFLCVFQDFTFKSHTLFKYTLCLYLYIKLTSLNRQLTFSAQNTSLYIPTIPEAFRSLFIVLQPQGCDLLSYHQFS